MNWGIALRLGRVSNLPTVWSNALAGLVLAGGLLQAGSFTLLIMAVSLAYVGGMFLNDAFDADIDARERPERPIPSGQVARATVYGWGYAMLAASIVALGAAGTLGGGGLWPAAAAIALAAMILLYNWHHKANPMGPLVMGMCRVLVYIAAGLTATTAPLPALGIGAGLLLCHLIGLTYVAKQENLARIGHLWPIAFLAAPLLYGLFLIDGVVAIGCWAVLLLAVLFALRCVRRRDPGDMPRAVMTLIAAISLLDALLVAGAGQPRLALLAACGFPVTLFLQRHVRGT